MSLLANEVHYRLKDNSLIKITEMIKWEGLREKMGGLGRSGYGPSGYDPLGMLKALILQGWHSLSDLELEEAIKVRMDFMAITNLLSVPDHTTLCRFRNLLIKQGIFEFLLEEVNHQLEELGLKVEKSKGAIVDATIIQSAARPRKEIEAMPEDGCESEVVYEIKKGTQEVLSKDPDSTWLKKGRKSYFGYKGFAITDAEDGYIDKVAVTPANKSELKELESIMKGRQDKRLYADKGYASEDNKGLLRSKGIKNAIMEKAKKNKPLSHWQKVFNKLISKVRYRVEQCFGTLKRRFRFTRASYMTQKKVEAQMLIKAICFNLLKASNKAKIWKITPKIRLV